MNHSNNFPENKIVLVRVCYDLPLDISNTIRIEDSKNSVEELLSRKNKVVLATHWSRPKGLDKKLSTKKLLKSVEEVLKNKIEFVNQFESFEKAAEKIKNSDSKIFLLENTRFEDGEKSKDENKRFDLAKKYAILAEEFVDEAFAVSHRKEATNYEIKKLLTSHYGISFLREKQALEKIKEKPEKPFSIIMGGAKLETKLPIIEKLLPKADNVLIGGLLSFTFVKAAQEMNLSPWKDLDIGNSKIEIDFVEKAKELIKNYPNKIYFPVDYIFADIGFGKEGVDSGVETLKIFKEKLKNAKTIFWNGPIGFYEKEPFDKGTKELGEFVSRLDAWTVAGGGDIVSALTQESLSRFKFVSMGGGATLKFLAK